MIGLRPLQVAFTTGAIMGFTVVGLGLFGLSAMYLLVGIDYNNQATMQAREPDPPLAPPSQPPRRSPDTSPPRPPSESRVFATSGILHL
eukprot:425033-Prorocentrum_minimum.AAC.1